MHNKMTTLLSKRLSWIRGHLAASLCAVLLAALAGTALPMSLAAANQFGEFIVSQIFNTTVASPPGDSFTYKLVPVPNPSFPPPPSLALLATEPGDVFDPIDGSLTFTLTGTEDRQFILDFTGVGPVNGNSDIGGNYLYTYNLTHITSPTHPNFGYDNTAYTIAFSVENDLNHLTSGNLLLVATVAHKSGQIAKVGEIEYTHSYAASSTTTTTTTTTTTHPTGSTTRPTVIPTTPTTLTTPTTTTTTVKPSDSSKTIDPTVETGSTGVTTGPTGGTTGPTEPTGQTTTDPGTTTKPPPTTDGGEYHQGGKHWALLNLILCLLGILLATLSLIKALRWKKDVEKEGYLEVRTVRYLWLIITTILAVVGVIFFLLTEDMRLPMVIVDIWTIINAIIFAMGIISLWLTFKKEKAKENNP